MKPPHSFPAVRPGLEAGAHPASAQARGEAGESLSIRVREESTQTFVTAAGELDGSTAAAFNRCMWDAQSGDRQVVLDLRALVFIDADGLRSLLAAAVRASEAHRRLTLVCAYGQVRIMLSLSGLDELIETVEPLTPLQASLVRRVALHAVRQPIPHRHLAAV
jgi:anti-anti-sigma factor